MHFIELHQADEIFGNTDPVWINAERITILYQVAAGTRIVFAEKAPSIIVSESMQDVLCKIARTMCEPKWGVVKNERGI